MDLLWISQLLQVYDFLYSALGIFEKVAHITEKNFIFVHDFWLNTGNPYVNTTINQVINIVSNVLTYTADIFGRRRVLIISFILAGIFCILSMVFKINAEDNQCRIRNLLKFCFLIINLLQQPYSLQRLPLHYVENYLRRWYLMLFILSQLKFIRHQ